MSVSCKHVNNRPILPAIGLFIPWPDSVNVHNPCIQLICIPIPRRPQSLDHSIISRPLLPLLQDPASPSTVSSPSSSRLVAQIIGAEDDYFDSDQEQVSPRLEDERRLSFATVTIKNTAANGWMELERPSVISVSQRGQDIFFLMSN